jgi:hypothetical protein
MWKIILKSVNIMPEMSLRHKVNGTVEGTK